MIKIIRSNLLNELRKLRRQEILPEQEKLMKKMKTFENCAPYTDCMSERNNTQTNNADYMDSIMLFCDSIEHGDNYLKISGGLRQYYRDKLNNAILDLNLK